MMEKYGVGLHTGVLTKVRVLPAAVGEGRYFVRVDLPGAPVIPVRVEAVVSTSLSTELGWKDARVRTVEHLLAALVALAVHDARIEIDGPELPLLDGSAAEWVEALGAFPGRCARGSASSATPLAHRRARERVGSLAEPWAVQRFLSESAHPMSKRCAMRSAISARQSTSRVGERQGGRLWTRKAPITKITELVWVQRGDAFVCAMPASKTRFTYGIDFSLPAIGNQWHSWEPVSEDFATEIAPARTFGLADQIQQLREQGLIKGGTLDNALVCGADGWLNPPLRFANEPVRHKLLDLVGDMGLLGIIPVAHYLAYKASHQLHVQLAQKICASTMSPG